MTFINIFNFIAVINQCSNLTVQAMFFAYFKGKLHRRVAICLQLKIVNITNHFMRFMTQEMLGLEIDTFAGSKTECIKRFADGCDLLYWLSWPFLLYCIVNLRGPDNPHFWIYTVRLSLNVVIKFNVTMFIINTKLYLHFFVIHSVLYFKLHYYSLIKCVIIWYCN